MTTIIGGTPIRPNTGSSTSSSGGDPRLAVDDGSHQLFGG
jgi:hypothetical protein